MKEAASFPFEAPVLVVAQPLGTFYVAALPAKLLLDVCYSHRLRAKRQEDGSYKLDGSQREILKPRLKAIASYIDTAEAAFPNSLILAANISEETSAVEESDDVRWELSLNRDGKTGTLKIPTSAKLAAVIDGQHRLFGYRFASEVRLKMPLVCCIYFDLPKPYQAFLFATINSNQKSVDKSQTYELFGYNVEEEDPVCWTPDKLAVFIGRKLNSEPDSPLHQHITIAAENDIVQTMSEARRAGYWMVSTATIVEGIIRLISKNAKNDAYTMNERAADDGRARKLLVTNSEADNEPPLRPSFLNSNDKLIHTVAKNFFTATNDLFWKGENPGFIRKTVGVQALFDILRRILPDALSKKDVSVKYFKQRLASASEIKFTDDFFQASGTGRTRIRNVLEIAAGTRNLESLSDKPDFEGYRKMSKLLW